MKKSAKLLLLLLSASLASQMISGVNINATKDSITFYDVKNNILDLKAYDAELDTNHDGNMNVFDVIRANKTLIQEESYTDLKEKVYMLETQIESLYQKLNEKADNEEGKQLSSNDYTDEEKQKLESLNNYDDTQIKTEVSDLSGTLSMKVDKEEGKQLSSNDYTDEEKQKLEGLNNYDDSRIKTEVSELSGALSGKVDKEEGKQLSSNDYTDEEKQKLEGLNDYNDTEIKSELQKQNDLIDSLVDTASKEKSKYDSLISEIEENKVNKEEGKQLSSNDFTNEEKQKLESLNNYDDAEIKSEINELKNSIDDLNEMIPSISLFESIGVIGDSFASGYLDVADSDGNHDHYNISWPQQIGRLTNIDVTNYTISGITIQSWYANNGIYGLSQLLSDTPKDLYIFCMGINDGYVYGNNPDYLGSSSDLLTPETDPTHPDTFWWYYVNAIRKIKEHAPCSKIVLCTTQFGANSVLNKSSKYETINQSIIEIAEYCGLQYRVVNDDSFFTSDFFKDNTDGHPKPVTYSAMAKAYIRIIESGMQDNTSYYNDYGIR